ncbi:MAG: hypothetical protein HY039_02580 [Nitrospirae bacterium]|nr:hypothetical protein [Nitrospirota bacterium]
MTEGSENRQVRVDVKVLMEELRAEVARKRESGEYPAEWFAKGDPDSADPEARDDLDANLRRANETCLLKRREKVEESGSGNPAARFLKRILQKMVLFHTDFLADQIDRHNAAVVRVLNRYKGTMEEGAFRAARNEDVMAKYGQRIADLEDGRTAERIEAVEKALRDKGMLS